MKNKVKRIMIAGTGSGCGKTTVVCGLLKALLDRGEKVSSFKCGPDYIDPMFHSEIIGTSSRNLDLYLCGEDRVRYLLMKNMDNAEYALIEGVMGLYDGLGFDSDSYSSNHLSKVIEAPVLLVVGVKGKSRSLLAEIKGYLSFAENKIGGIILNKCSAAMYPYYKKMIEENFDICCYGFLPSMEEAELGSRHLGLVTAAEVEDLKEKIAVMGQAAEEYLDIDGILAFAGTAPVLSCKDPEISVLCQEPVPIAVARDKAFCFYYEDNFDLLKSLGAELVFFSPLHDSALPEGVHGLILGGGYPEEHLAELSANTAMRRSIKEAATSGLPIYAECGGFMYLGETITKDEKPYPVAGVLEGNSYMTNHLVRFGYKELIANRDNLMCAAGEKIRCHEFHYSDTDRPGDGFTAKKSGGKTWKCIEAGTSIFAGYPHLHFWSNPSFAENFVKKCCEFGGHTWK